MGQEGFEQPVPSQMEGQHGADTVIPLLAAFPAAGILSAADIRHVHRGEIQGPVCSAAAITREASAATLLQSIFIYSTRAASLLFPDLPFLVLHKDSVASKSELRWSCHKTAPMPTDWEALLCCTDFMDIWFLIVFILLTANGKNTFPKPHSIMCDLVRRILL